MLFDASNWVTKGTPAGAGAIGTNLVICGIVIGDCMFDKVGIVCVTIEDIEEFCKANPDGDIIDCAGE